MVAEDSATEVGSIVSRHKAATVDHTPAPASVQDDGLEKQPLGDEQVTEFSSEVSPASAAADEDDGVEYPVAWKLGLITIALCLSVFCVALVRFPTCF